MSQRAKQPARRGDSGSPAQREVLHPERFDPATGSGTLTASEHYLRYAWAAQLAPNREILDAGSGTGYGARILAEAGAVRVVGAEIADEVVEAARTQNPALDFVVADVHGLPFDDASFDLVTCFEVIEHLEGRSAVLAELKRVLRPDGILLVSSPNRAAYPEGNPHHVFEYLPAELRAEVGAVFLNVALYRQDAWLASMITSDEGLATRDPSRDAPIAVRIAPARAPSEMSFAVVAASDAELPALADRSVFGDPFEVRWWQDQQAAATDAVGDARRELERARREVAESLDAATRARTERDQVRGELERARAEVERARALARRDVDEARAQARQAGAALVAVEAKRAQDLEATREAAAELQALREAHKAAHETVQAMQRTRVWQLGSTYWRIRDLLLGRSRR